MPTTDQISDAVAAAAQIPINNGLIIAVLIALGIVVLGGVLIWRFAPIFINLYKQQAETNAKLTQIVGQNSEQAKLAMASVDKNTGEMVRQTEAIVGQTAIIEGQGRALRSYQTLVSDNLASHTEQIATNTENIAELKKSIDHLSEQIKNMLEDKAACADAEQRIEKLRDEIIALVTKQQTKRDTGEVPAVPAQPAVLIPDDANASASQAGEAAA